MSLLALGVTWFAVATVAALALAAAIRRNTARTRRPLPLRDPGVALAEAQALDQFQQAIDDYETCAALENRTWKENQS